VHPSALHLLRTFRRPPACRLVFLPLLLLLLLLLQVSWDFHNAAKHGFTLLQQQIEQLSFQDSYHSYTLVYGLKGLPAADGWSWQQWADLLSDPLPYKLNELKEAAKQLHVSRSGTKAELVVRLLGAFGLKAPSNAPPQLLRALALERMCLVPWQGSDTILEPRHALYQLCALFNEKVLPPDIQQQLAAVKGGLTLQQHAAAGNAAAWRQLLVSIGVESKAQLLQLKERAELTCREVSAALVQGYMDAHGVNHLAQQTGDVAAGDVQGEAAQQGGAAVADVQGQAAQEVAAALLETAAAAQQGAITATEAQAQADEEAAAAAAQHAEATVAAVQGQAAQDAAADGAAAAAAAQAAGASATEVQGQMAQEAA
jgi:hypothetical protein